MSTYASWVHGHAVVLERVGALNVHGKSGVAAAFAGRDGDTVELGIGSYAAVACVRIGTGARFVVYDSGDQDLPKSGRFWAHYAIPTPVLEAGKRAHAASVLLNYHSTDIAKLSVVQVHVWDGNHRIFADDNPAKTGDGFAGGIPPGTSPDTSKLYRGKINDQPVYFGLGVSLNIRAENAKNVELEIRGVGIDFNIA